MFYNLNILQDGKVLIRGAIPRSDPAQVSRIASECMRALEQLGPSFGVEITSSPGMLLEWSPTSSDAETLRHLKKCGAKTAAIAFVMCRSGCDLKQAKTYVNSELS